MTDIIAGKRRTGKSTELIRRAANDGGFIITENDQSRRLLMKMAHEFGYNIQRPVTYYEFINEHHRGLKMPCVHIDDGERLLQYAATGVHVATITITEE
jgi:hypothetical protein